MGYAATLGFAFAFFVLIVVLIQNAVQIYLLLKQNPNNKIINQK
jgi:hypothetical protein